MGRKLRETIVLAGVIYPEGTAEKDIDGKVEADVWDGEAKATKAEPAAPTGYGSMNKEALQAEVDKRNADLADDAKIVVTGTGANGNVVVGDLVTALEANDAANKA